MMEMLAVVAIISMLAALASPSFIRQLRDNRVNRAAMHVSEAYRHARMRALGRGTAVLVRWNSEGGPGSKGLLETFEPGNLANAFPNPSCASPRWDIPTDNRRVDFFAVGNGLYDGAEIAFFREAASVSTKTVDICFTPRGRTYIRNDTTGTFVALAGAARYDVKNTASTRTRQVFVPPNGVARLAL
jgi:type IV fimbrial biogenesis protein FimT